MEPESLTLRVLVEMRDEMRGFREEQRTTHQGIAGAREELSILRGEMVSMREEQHQTNLRLGAIETTLLDAATQIRVLAGATRVTLDSKRAHEERFDDLERRVTELERQRR